MSRIEVIRRKLIEMIKLAGSDSHITLTIKDSLIILASYCNGSCICDYEV